MRAPGAIVYTVSPSCGEAAGAVIARGFSRNLLGCEKNLSYVGGRALFRLALIAAHDIKLLVESNFSSVREEGPGAPFESFNSPATCSVRTIAVVAKPRSLTTLLVTRGQLIK